MAVFDGKGRHRRPTRHFTRALATTLLVVLLAGAPATPSIPTSAERLAAGISTEEN